MRLAHGTMYLGSAPRGGVKDLLLLDYIDRSIYNSLEAEMEAKGGRMCSRVATPSQGRLDLEFTS
jgi:hypothetical protein